MTPEKRINRLTNWQVGLFIVPIALHVIRLIKPPTADSDGQLTWTLVRFSITVLALATVGILGWRKRQIRKEAKAPPSPIQPSFDI